MIIPSNRLIVWSSIIFFPFFGLSGILPELLNISIAAAAVFIIFICLDSATGYYYSKYVIIEFPEAIKIIRAKESVFCVRISKIKNIVISAVLSVGFPEEIKPVRKTEKIVMNKFCKNYVCEIKCKGISNGQYRIDISYIHILSKFGFWNIRKSIEKKMDIRTYPDIKKEIGNIAGFFARQNGIGIHNLKQYGKGREFDKLREYMNGDNYEDIHWKISAKRGKPITKIFQTERTQEVYLVIDSSRLSRRKILDLNKCPDSKAIIKNREKQPAYERESKSEFDLKSDIDLKSELAPDFNENAQTILDKFIASALITGLAIEKCGDLFGLIISNDRTENFIRAGRGRKHYNICKNVLFDVKSRLTSPDYEELFNFIGLNIRRRALLIILTNLDEPVLAENFYKASKSASPKHLVCVNIPDNKHLRPLFSDSGVESLDDIYAKLGNHIIWKDIREIEKKLARNGIMFKTAKINSFGSDIASQYLEIKKRQLI